MPVLPRNILKQYFQRGDRPTEGQFDSLLDSTLNIIDDRYLLGLRVYDPAKIYIAGDTMLYNGSLYQCIIDTTGVFNPVDWQIVTSLGAVVYAGVWDAASNTPTLADATGTKGFYYVVTVPGTIDLGSGLIEFAISDWAIYNGTVWQKVDNSESGGSSEAIDINFTPNGDITATNVQDAIVQVRNTTDLKLAGKQNTLALTPDYYPFANSSSTLADGALKNEAGGVALGNGKVFKSYLPAASQIDFQTGNNVVISTDGGQLAESHLTLQAGTVLLRNNSYGELSITSGIDLGGELSLGNVAGNGIVINNDFVELSSFSGNRANIKMSSSLIEVKSDLLQIQSTQTNFAALNPSSVPVIDASKNLISSSVTPTELDYLSGITSAIQPQLDNKLNRSGGTMSGDLILSADPSVSLGAATKQYVDSGDTALQSQLNAKLNIAGGTMTGNLFLSADPVASAGAATKRYVDTGDAALQSQLNAKLNVAGGTMTGDLVLNANPTIPLGAATKQYTDLKLALGGGTMSGDLILNADPAVSLQAATKRYVDTGDASLQSQLNAKLNLAGGTMTGDLILNVDPTATLGAATKQYVDAADTALQNQLNAKLNLAGGTMTGNLFLSADPVASVGAATKRYVDTGDSVLQSQLSAKLNLAGGTMTGDLVLNANPAIALGAATKQYVDGADTALQTQVNGKLNLAGGTMTGNLILNVDPTVALGAATKQYADLKLPLAGGTMTGNLILNANPAAALGAATKQYADLKLALTGGTMTGNLVLNANPTVALGAATKQYVDAADALKLPLAGGTMTGAITLSANPVNPLEAATKQYVDAAVVPQVKAIALPFTFFLRDAPFIVSTLNTWTRLTSTSPVLQMRVVIPPPGTIFPGTTKANGQIVVDYMTTGADGRVGLYDYTRFGAVVPIAGSDFGLPNAPAFNVITGPSFQLISGSGPLTTASTVEIILQKTAGAGSADVRLNCATLIVTYS